VKEVRIFGIPAEVRAEVENLQALSGHADGEELLAWIQPARKGLKRVFLVHGEPEESAALAESIRGVYQIEATSVRRGEIYELIPETQNTAAAF
jgi:metallo-beta-lactamase family protein